MPYIFKHIFRHAHLIIFIVYFYIKALYIFTWVIYVYIYKKYTATSMFKYMLNQGGHMSGKTRKSGKKRMWHIYVHMYFVHMYGARNIHATYKTHVSNHALSNTRAATKCYICNIYYAPRGRQGTLSMSTENTRVDKAPLPRGAYAIFYNTCVISDVF